MMGSRIGDVCAGRDNNLNLIRMIAAIAVLVSHAYPIAYGIGTPEPFQAAVGIKLGTMAVFVFFGISGFLIARSFDRKVRLEDWIAARILRLFPGLAVMALLTVLVLGPLVTTLPLSVYLSDPALPSYVLRTLGLVSLQQDLPGVFETLPYPSTLNGSLWSLFHEVACYFGILVAGVAGLLGRRGPGSVALAVYFGAYVLFSLPQAAGLLPLKLQVLVEMSLPFALGTGFYIWRDTIRLSWLGVAVLGGLAILTRSTPVFSEVFILWLCYTVFVLAYLPSGFVRSYNRLGDYSYGIYIYAFPIQQTWMHFRGPMTALENIALSLPVTLVLAVLSWVLVEKPGLESRHRMADWMATLARGASSLRM